ncbi:MAG: SprB repeat-containing protein [Marinifilaceae bacterium]
MRFRFLLFLFLGLLFNNFVAFTQGLVYNGQVRIEISISKIQAYDVDENKSDGPDNKFNIRKKSSTDKDYVDYRYITGTSVQNVKAWRDWTSLSITLPSWFHYKTYSVSNTTLIEFFKKPENVIEYELHAWEKQGATAFHGSKKRYNYYWDITLFDIIKDDLSPGWHTSKKFINKGDKHWAIQFQYSITPPIPAIKAHAEIHKSGDKPIQLETTPLDYGSNVYYEWEVNVNNAGHEEFVEWDITDYSGYYRCMRECEEFKMAENEQNESTLRSNRETNVEIGSSLSKFNYSLEGNLQNVEFDPTIGPKFDKCEDICGSEFGKRITKYIVDFSKANDVNLKTNITPNGKLSYQPAQSSLFHRNMKFRVTSFVKSGTKKLKSVSPSQEIVLNVFPPFPQISLGGKKKVTCFGGSDGEITVNIDGDVNNGVDEYRIGLRKMKDSNSAIYTKNWNTTSSHVQFDTLSQGVYKISVSNSFSRVDTNEFFNSHSKVKDFFLVGHVIQEFEIDQNPKLTLTDFDFETTGNCDEYKIINPAAGGGVSGYTYSLTGKEPYGAVNSLGPAILFSGKETSKSATLYMKDKVGCKVSHSKSRTRNKTLDLGLGLVPSEPIKCHGETGSLEIFGSGGAAPYRFYQISIDTKNEVKPVGTIASGFKGGNHAIFVKDKHGCSVRKTISLKEPELITFDLNYPIIKNLGCYNAQNGEVTMKFKGGTGNYVSVKLFHKTKDLKEEMKDVARNAEVTFKNLKADTYYVEVHDAMDCSFTSDNFVVSQPNDIEITHTGTGYTDIISNEVFDFSCNNASEDINVVVKGGTPPYEVYYGTLPSKSVSKENGKAPFRISEENPVFQITDAGTCDNTRDLDLLMPAALSIKISAPKYEADNGDVFQIRKKGGTEDVDVLISGGIAPFNYELLKSGSIVRQGTSQKRQLTFTGLTEGNYRVRVANTCNEDCDTEEPFQLDEPEILEVTTSSPKTNEYEIQCYGLTGRIKVLPKGGIYTYTLKLTGPGGYSETQKSKGEEKIFKDLKAGEYYLSVNDKYQTKLQTIKIPIRQPEKLKLELESPKYHGFNIPCSYKTGSVLVTPSGGLPKYSKKYTYTVRQMNPQNVGLEENDVAGPIRFSDLNEGTHTYTVSDANGCEAIGLVTLTKPKLLDITKVNLTMPSCNNKDMGETSLQEDGKIQVSALGGVGINGSEYKFHLLREATETTPEKSTTMKGKIGTFNGLISGMYRVVVEDANACYDTVNDNRLNQRQLLQIVDKTINKPRCHGDANGEWKSTILGGTVTDGSYTYSILKDDKVFRNGSVPLKDKGSPFAQDNLAFGEYTIKINDDLGCLFQMDTLVKQPAPLVNTLDVMGVNILDESNEFKFKCFGDNNRNELQVAGGTPNYTVEIRKEGIPFEILSGVPENSTRYTQEMTSGHYSIVTTDDHDCQSPVGEFFLDQPLKIKLSHSGPSYTDENTGEVFDYTCFGADQLIDVTVEGGTPGYHITYKGVKKDISDSGETTQFVVTDTLLLFDVWDENGCNLPYRDTLNQPDPIELKLTPSIYTSGAGIEYNIKCHGGVDNLQVAATGGIAPYTFELTGMGRKESLISVDGTGTFSNLPAGDYSVRVVGNFDEECDRTGSITLVEPDKLDVVAILSNHNGFEIKCNGFSDTLWVEPKGGIFPYYLKLEGPSGLQEKDLVGEETVFFKGLTAGTYKLSLTDSKDACEFTSSYTLTQPKALGVELITSSYPGGYQIRCSNQKDSVIVIPGGGLPPTGDFEYTIVQIDEEGKKLKNTKPYGEAATFRNLDEGKYTYQITDINKCFLSDFVVLTKPDPLRITSVDFTIPSCHEDDMGDLSKRQDGEIAVDVEGGVGFAGNSYDFLLNSMAQPEARNRMDSIRGTVANFTKLATGEYIIQVKDTNSCWDEWDHQLMKQKPLLHLVNFKSTIPECYNADNGKWVSTIEGGTASKNIYNYILSKDGEEFRSGITGPQWDQNRLRTGDYTIEITDDLGCYYRQEEKLLQPDVMAINFDVMGVTAFGAADGAAEARVTGGNGGYRYQWYHKGTQLTGEQNSKLGPLGAGEYTLEVWDEKNCPYGNTDFGRVNGLKKSVEVKEPGGKLSIVVSPVQPSYFGASDGSLEVSAVGGWPYAVWPGYQFSLNHGEWKIAKRFENLTAGWYQLRVKDSKGVMDSLRVEIKQPEKIIIKLEKSDCLCAGDQTGQVNVSVLGGTPPYQYALNHASGFNRQNQFTELTAGTYRIYVKDKLGNIQSEFVDIDQPEDLQLQLLNRIHSTCNGSNGSVQIQVSGGTPSYYIKWSGMNPENRLAPVGLAAGNYKVQVTDRNACAESLEVSIQEKKGPEILLKEIIPATCHQAKDGKITVDVSGGTQPFDFSWNELPGVTTPFIEDLGKGSYSVLVSDINNCFDEATFELSGPDPLELYVSSIQPPNCVGIDDGMLQLQAEGGTPGYTYSLNGQEKTSGLFVGLGAGPLELKLRDSHGCQEQLEAEMNAPVPVVIEMPADYYLCRNQSQPITAGIEGSSSRWFFEGEEIGSQSEIEVSGAGRYHLLLTSDKGCEANFDFNVFQLDYEVVADFVIPGKGIVGDTLIGVDISWEMPDSIHWQLPDAFKVVKREESSVWLQVLKPGVHTVGLTVFKEECSDYLEKTVTVENSGSRKACLVRPDEVYIKEAILYPNPNRGDFSVKVVLSKPADASVEILDIQNAARIDSRKGTRSAVYEFKFNDQYYFVPNRVYVALVRVGRERRSLRFVVH